MDNFLYKLHTVWQIYNALQAVMYFKFVLGETRYNSEKKIGIGCLGTDSILFYIYIKKMYIKKTKRDFLSVW